MTTIGLIQVDLLLDSAGGVTAPEMVDSALDLPLSRTGDDTVWTPPTSLAGSLRTHLGDRAARWLGADPPPPGRGPDQGALEPSRVRFLGTRTTPNGDTSIRRSTAIDPVRGAASTATLRAAELAPAGTTIQLYLRLDGTDPTELDDLASALADWQPVVGRGRSTGRGRARPTRIAWRLIDLRTRAGLHTWLTGRREALFADTDREWDRVLPVAAPATTDPVLELELEVASALRVGVGSSAPPDAHDESGGPQDTGNSPPTRASLAMLGDAAMVPATSWKGLLRARCGYILRSCGRPACLVPATGSTACGRCTLCELFGWTTRDPGPGQPIGRVGRLAFHDSPVTGDITYRNHVSIDRFTGGARRGLLFAEDVVAGGRVDLRITTTDATDKLTPAERGLLLLAVRDLHDGIIGVGHGSTRGYGDLRLAARSHAVLDELEPAHPTGAAIHRLLTGDQP